MKVFIPKDEEIRELWESRLPHPDSVRKSFGPAVFEYGWELFKGGMVTDVKIAGRKAGGVVRTGRKPLRPSWEITPNGRLGLECTCKQFAYCAHQVALYLETYEALVGPAEITKKSAAVLTLPAKNGGRRRVVKVKFEKTKVCLELGQGRGEILLKAELRGVNSDHKWPMDGETYRIAAGGKILACRKYDMNWVFSNILYAGFEMMEPGRFRMRDEYAISDFLSRTLFHWLEDYQVTLDDHLKALVENRTELASTMSIRNCGEIDRFEFDCQLEFDGETLTVEDLWKMYTSGADVIFSESGKLVGFDHSQLMQYFRSLEELGYKFRRDGGPIKLPLHFLARAVEHGSNGNGSSPIQKSVEISEELRDLYKKLSDFDGVKSVRPPGKLAKALRPYQKDGLNFLNFLSEFRFGGILADDMGLGKTVQALALLDLKRRESKQHQPSLVVCPTTVAPNWIQEVKKFTPQIKAVHLGSSRAITDCSFEDYDLIIISYGLMRRNKFETAFRYMILDEAQNIKNPKTKIAKAVKSVDATYRLALTGTPIENSVYELWSIFDFLMPGFLGSFNHFKWEYAERIMGWGDRDRLSELSRHVRPFFLRRLKQDVASDLPPKTEQDIVCELTPKQNRLYWEVVESIRSELNRKIDSDGWQKSQIHILSALTRLRQICCHPALWEPKLKTLGSGKMTALSETLDSVLSGGHRVVIFSQFVKMMKLVEEDLKKTGTEYLYLDGGTRNRGALIDKFQKDKRYKVFLMSLKAGGTGINLTAADYVILLDPWWNPAVENQAIDRTHRIGQTRPVTAYRLLTRGTIEEKMEELKDRKRDLAERVLSSEAEFFKKMTRDDLEYLLEDGE
jgi:non-specific serine/threonine protein kinase